MAKKKIEVSEVEISSLFADNRNANKHTESGDALVSKSINELGLGRSVLVDANNMLIAGNGVQRQAIAAGKTKALVVDIDGDTLLVARRADMNLEDPNDPRARQMALVDNSSALAGIQFDFEVAQSIGDDFGFSASDWGVDYAVVGGKPVEMDCELEFAQEMGIGKEYLLIVFEDDEQYRDAVDMLQLKKVVEMNLGKKELNNKGTERVLFFNDFKNRYANSGSINGEG